jgi:hypothetical protein
MGFSRDGMNVQAGAVRRFVASSFVSAVYFAFSVSCSLFSEATAQEPEHTPIDTLHIVRGFGAGHFRGVAGVAVAE